MAPGHSLVRCDDISDSCLVVWRSEINGIHRKWWRHAGFYGLGCGSTVKKRGKRQEKRVDTLIYASFWAWNDQKRDSAQFDRVLFGMRLRISRTTRDQLEELVDSDKWFEAWNELRRLQRGESELHCCEGCFDSHWCPSGTIGFRVSRPCRDLAQVWHLVP